MKRVFLMRHAKSSWEERDIADFDRPLNKRGRNAANLMGKLIAHRQFDIGTIVSSPARRASDTAVIVRDIIAPGREIDFVERIYEASPQALSSVLSGIKEVSESALLVGHNPGMEGFIKLLTARNETMPTAALAVIDLAVKKWSEIMPGCGTLVEVIRPKEQTSG